MTTTSFYGIHVIYELMIIYASTFIPYRSQNHFFKLVTPNCYLFDILLKKRIHNFSLIDTTNQPTRLSVVLLLMSPSSYRHKSSLTYLYHIERLTNSRHTPQGTQTLSYQPRLSRRFHGRRNL